MVGIVRVVGLRHRLGDEVEGLATEGLLKGLEVRRVDALRPPERIDFGRKCGYERCAPISLATRSAAASARRYTVRSRVSKSKRIHRIVKATTQRSPKDATHWSTRTMARAMGTTHSFVHRVWQSHGLKPHLIRTLQNQQRPAI